ncbi:hypothetical protein G7054_g11508 [Neopestalotiopsis clavispora]|nr:hypothetical protein G7054_g11508 [Neopestalotiopsis clavispora]
MSTKKRTIDAFFGAPKAKPSLHDNAKKSRVSTTTDAKIGDEESQIKDIQDVDIVGRSMTDQPDLDLLYFEPYLPRSSAKELFEFLRSSLPFYRVEYDIKRGGISTHIRTPRWTTVFGLDETSRFAPATDDGTAAEETTNMIVDAKTGREVVGDRDDERFLGPLPAIASFSLGARRDFYMKHKPSPPPNNKTKTSSTDNNSSSAAPEAVDTAKPLKLPLGSGDMILMRGTTQANWLHSIPKRSGKNAEDGGRINITFRRAMVKAGTENYYNYNVGTGPVYRWDAVNREMRKWEQPLS